MDTATFAHPNATPRTLAVSAALVAAGAPLAEISRRLYRTKPDVQLRLFGRVLDRLQTAAGGLVVHSTLLAADIAETGALSAHSEGIIDLLSQSEAAEVALLFKEAAPDATRVSRPDEARRRRCDGPDRALRRRGSRPRCRSVDRVRRRRGARARPARGGAARGRRPPLTVARRTDAPGLDGVLDPGQARRGRRRTTWWPSPGA